MSESKYDPLILACAEKNGIKTASALHAVSEGAIRRWARKYKVNLSNYQTEIELAALDYAITHSIEEAAREYDVSTATIKKWSKANDVEISKGKPRGRDGQTVKYRYRPEIMEHARLHGPSSAAKEFGVSRSMIYRWAKEYGVVVKSVNEKIDQSMLFKIEVLTYMSKTCAKEAAYHFDLNLKMICRWRRDYRKLLKLIEPIKSYLLHEDFSDAKDESVLPQ